MKNERQKRRASALKGWRTRRSNARRRSESAKKGWRTRRRNLRAMAQRARPRRARLGAKRPPPSEYVVHFDYGSKRKGNVIDVQVHLIGPAGANDREAVEAARAFMKDERMPKNWKVKVIKWRNQQARGSQLRDAADALRFAILGKTRTTR